MVPHELKIGSLYRVHTYRVRGVDKLSLFPDEDCLENPKTIKNGDIILFLEQDMFVPEKLCNASPTDMHRLKACMEQRRYIRRVKCLHRDNVGYLIVCHYDNAFEPLTEDNVR